MPTTTDNPPHLGDDFSSIYVTYRHSIQVYLARLLGDWDTAEDLCQETFLKALRSWNKQIRPTSAGWLYRIAANTAYDHIRRQRIRCTPLLEVDPILSAEHPVEASLTEGAPVRAALAQLPLHYRTPLVLHICEGRSLREIAEALGCSHNAVRMRLFRAREYFRQIYQA